MKRRLAIDMLMAACLSALPLLAHGQLLLKEDERVSFDTANFVAFQEVTAGNRSHVKLYGSRDGKPFTWDLVDPTNPSRPVILSEILQIKYADKDRVWIVSGHRAPCASLLDLGARKVEKEFGGYLGRLSLSPDLKHVAYSSGIGECQVAVFVDDVLVYPNIEAGLTGDLHGLPAKADGTPVWRFIPEDPTRRLVSPLQWKNDSTIEFTTEENGLLAELTEGQYPSQKVKYVISGLTSPEGQITSGNVRLARSLLPDGKETTPTVLTSYSWPTAPSLKALEAKMFPDWFNTSPLLKKADKISFDENNVVTPEELADSEVRLGILRDGSPSQPVVFRIPSPWNRISSQVAQIAYSDKDKVWIVFRQRGKWGNAVKFDLNTRAFAEDYSGLGFSLSPDVQHIAFAFPSAPAHFACKVGVFVDNNMIYPAVQTRFKMWYGIPESADGEYFDNFLRKLPTSRLASSIRWKDNSTVEFLIGENWLAAELLGDESRQQYLLCTVSGLLSPGGSAMQLHKTPLTKEAFLERTKKP